MRETDEQKVFMQQSPMMAFPLATNGRFILLISASFITIFSSIAIYFCLPILISHVIRTQLSLSSSSGSFNEWRLNSVVDQVYLYNISNLDAVLSEANRHSPSQIAIRPKLKQIGPFTFRQDREKLNIRFDTTRETVTYDQKKSWTFLPELSLVRTIDELKSTFINHINVPLAGTTLDGDYAEFVDPVIVERDLKLFMNNSANSLLFEGYPDILMELAKSQGTIDVDKFGWMHNLNNSVTRNIRVFTGPSNATLDKLGALDQFNNTNRFDVWHINNTEPTDTKLAKCNEFRLSSAGEFFPPPKYSIISHNNDRHNSRGTNDNLSGLFAKSISEPKLSIEFKNSKSLQDINEKTGKTISLFMPDLCRTYTLVYNGTFTYRDLTVDRYIADKFTYDYNDNIPDNPNKCYCTYNATSQLTTCPPSGMMDLFMCRKGSPLLISLPHFLYSNQDMSLEPFLRLFEDATTPSEHDHGFFLDLETTLNIPVRAQIALQFNVRYKNEPRLSFTKDYSFLLDNPSPQNGVSKTLPDLYLPQMWIKSSVEVDERNMQNLRFIQKHLILVTPIATLIMFGCASILLVMSAKSAYDLTYGLNTRKSTSQVQEPGSSIDQNDNVFLNEKEKYFTLQLISGGKTLERADSKCDSNASTSRSGDIDVESEPLNK